MTAVNVFAADTDDEAAWLATSLKQQFVNLRRGEPGPLQAPIDPASPPWSELEAAGVEHALRYTIVGSPATVQNGLAAFMQLTAADELMVTGQIYDHTARLRSFELVAEVRDALAAGERNVATR
jgi:alkanesulfonate monooxygenase SsuD/methylene tetrahydromethanopterin reductase-like flavin-dependent oxidoreductase (luciferase family)